MRQGMKVIWALVLATAASAQPIEVPGERVSPPLPAHWAIKGYQGSWEDGRFKLAVTAEGDCRYEYRQECQIVGNPPRQVCHWVPVWTCNQAVANYRMPDQFTMQDKQVHFHGAGAPRHVGKIKQFLFWKWIELDDDVRVAATHDTARLRIGVSGEGGRDPRALFARQNGVQPAMGLVVHFGDSIDRVEAERVVRDAGFAGTMTPGNDWQDADPARGTLGLAVEIPEARALIQALQLDGRVTKIEPMSL